MPTEKSFINPQDTIETIYHLELELSNAQKDAKKWYGKWSEAEFALKQEQTSNRIAQAEVNELRKELNRQKEINAAMSARIASLDYDYKEGLERLATKIQTEIKEMKK